MHRECTKGYRIEVSDIFLSMKMFATWALYYYLIVEISVSDRKKSFVVGMKQYIKTFCEKLPAEMIKTALLKMSKMCIEICVQLNCRNCLTQNVTDTIL